MVRGSGYETAERSRVRLTLDPRLAPLAGGKGGNHEPLQGLLQDGKWVYRGV